MTIIPCDIYENVLNITNHCEVDVMGVEIHTPCIPLCITALSYAVNYCGYIYGHTELLSKIINLLKICQSPMVKEELLQIMNNK
tara:strand:+ start:127 stop:378 length:252 start_codon:yes stop_codon:yes gene_type:complete